MTVTGLLPTPVEAPKVFAEAESPDAPVAEPVLQEHEAVVDDLLRRVRYLLTLKGRPHPGSTSHQQ